jgi:hypothetical protein
MRQALLISAAVGSLLGGIGVAQAAGPLVPSELMFGRPYVEFGGGFNFSTLTLTNLVETGGCCDASITSSTPLGLGGAFYATVGAELMPGLRAELQTSFRTNAGAHFNVSAEGTGAVGVNATTFMLLANFWKDFDISDKVSLHVGGGVGFGSKSLAVTGATPTHQSVTGLAFLAGFGGDYAVTDNAKLTFNYTVSGVAGAFGSSTITTSDSGETVTGNFLKGLDQAATVGIRFSLAP